MFAHDVVVGDVIIIEAGMKVPADCLLFEGMDITVDEKDYNDGIETIVKKTISTGFNHTSHPDPFILS